MSQQFTTAMKNSVYKLKSGLNSRNVFAKSSSFKTDFNEDDTFDNGVGIEVKVKKWYEDFEEGSLLSSNDISYDELEKMKKEAKILLESVASLNAGKIPKSVSNSDFSWIKTVMSKGTKADKIAAYSILIQDSPVSNLHLLNNIIGMVKVGKKEWTLAVDSAVELFLHDLLPPDRKLILFSERPLLQLKEISEGNETRRKNLLLNWYFEHELKLLYRNFIVSINNIAHDSVDANKEKAITAMFKLLESNPEQEHILLRNIVNKLGDPSHNVGSKVIYILTNLLELHPNMREVVLEEVERLIFRPNISKRAQYYSICFLSQFCLSGNEQKLSKKLISVYLSVFKSCIKLGDVDSRMMSALLTGVNRAYPFVKEDAGDLNEHINTIYKVVHIGKPSVSIQALSLLYLMSGQSNLFSDRFFMVLYKKVSEPEIFNSTHHAMFLSLIFKSLTKDDSCERVYAFLKRLLQVSAYLSSPIICGILFIISEIIHKFRKKILLLEQNPDTSNFHFKNEEDDSEYEHYDDVNIDEGVDDPVPENFSCNRISLKEPTGLIPIKEEQSLKTWHNPYMSPEEAKAPARNYDPYLRNPLFSGANVSVCVELLKLTCHYHPSVSNFASKILNGERISYNGDPLKDFALIRFLDKFSFKNPKVLKPGKGEKETFSKFGKRKLYNKITVHRLRRSAQTYLKISDGHVPDDEKFLHSYIVSKQSSIYSKKDEDESDVDSVGSEEFENMLNNMTATGNDDVDFLNEAAAEERVVLSEDECGEIDNDCDDSDREGSCEESFDGDETDYISDEFMDDIDPDITEMQTPLKAIQSMRKRKTGLSMKHVSESAEEFSELVEKLDYKAGGSEAVSNGDNAGVKQLKWEERRNKISKKNNRNHGSICKLKGSRQGDKRKKRKTN